MPLGFENSGVEAGLIQRGGEFLSKEIQDAGKTIETAIIRNRSFKQAAEFGQQLSQINPQSDEWPQAAAALASQYPLAIASGLGGKIMEPMAKAYAGYRAAKTADAHFGNQVALENLRDRHIRERGGGGPVFTGLGGSPSPELPDANQDPLDVAGKMNGAGVAGVLSGSFGPAGYAAGAAAQAGADATPSQPEVLPPLPNGNNRDESVPDAASAMRRKRPIQFYLDQVGAINKQAQEAGSVVPYPKLAQVQSQANRLKAAEDKEIDTAIKDAKPAPKLVADAENPDILINSKTGTMVKKTDNGISRIGGEFEGKRLDQVKAGLDYRRDRAAQTDQAKALKSALDLLKDREKTEIATLRKFEAEEAKNTNEDQKVSLHARVVAQQKLAEETVGRRDGAEKAYERMLKAGSDVFHDEAEARAAGHNTGDIIMLINPNTGQPGRARLK